MTITETSYSSFDNNYLNNFKFNIYDSSGVPQIFKNNFPFLNNNYFLWT